MISGLDRAKALLAHQLNDEEHPAVRQEKLLLAIAELLADIAESLRHRTDDEPDHALGDLVQVVVGDDMPDWMNGQPATVHEWNGSKYQVVVRNQSGAPWYVWLTPEQIETP